MTRRNVAATLRFGPLKPIFQVLILAALLISAGCAAPGGQPSPTAAGPTLTAGPATSTHPPTASSTPAAPGAAVPIRAAFYYPWFPQSWDQSGLNPFTHYHPSLGYYSQDDPAIIRSHIAAMQYGHIQAGIASWWGQGHYTDARVPALLKAGEQAGFQWALYYELESQGDPSAETIRADLEYIREHYAASPAYLHIDGRFVVFVYADAQDNCEMSARWQAANTAGAYLVEKVFPGYRACPGQPDAWHEYAPDQGQRKVGTDSFIISPGFWKAGESTPRLARDLTRWYGDIQAMLKSGSRFELVTTFNEWGEGTAVESAAGWESPSGYGLFLDALHNDGVLPPVQLPTLPPGTAPLSEPPATITVIPGITTTPAVPPPVN